LKSARVQSLKKKFPPVHLIDLLVSPWLLESSRTLFTKDQRDSGEILLPKGRMAVPGIPEKIDKAIRSSVKDRK